MTRRFVDEAILSLRGRSGGRAGILAMKPIKGETLDTLLKAGAAVDALSVFAAISQAVG